MSLPSGVAGAQRNLRLGHLGHGRCLQSGSVSAAWRSIDRKSKGYRELTPLIASVYTFHLKVAKVAGHSCSFPCGFSDALQGLASHDGCQLQEIADHQVEVSFGGRLLHHDTGAVFQGPGDKAGAQSACRSRRKI
jgi:hypothetical protein